MSGFIVGLAPWIGYTVDSFTNLDSGSDKDNIKEYYNLSKQAITDDTSGAVVTLDLEAAYSGRLLVLMDHVNFVEVQLEADTEDGFTDPPVDNSPTVGYNRYTCWYEGALTRRRYKHAWLLSGADLRYLRFTIASQTPTNGVAYHFIGRIMVTNNVATLAKSPSGLRLMPFDSIGVNERNGVGAQLYSTSPYRAVDLSIRWDAGDRTVESDLLDNLLLTRPDQLTALWNNMNGDAAEFYVCQRRDTNVQIQWVDQQVRSFNEILFRECVSGD